MSKKKQPRATTSRRGFLRGAGLTTAGLAIAPALQARTPAPADPFTDPAATTFNLRVNGQVKTVTGESRLTLAEALREELHLTGTKVVCDRGACSCCTVYLDGEPVCSCLTLALDVDGRDVTTIEGLAPGDALHPVQQAFIDHDASMCGFCTPGMVMSCAKLVDDNPNATLDDVKQATSGNLCRCGTYPKVFSATLDAAAQTKRR